MSPQAARALRPLPLLASCLCLFAGCSDRGPAGGGGPDAADPDRALGERLYATLGCATCHGRTGGGMSTAPPLVDAERDWSLADLTEYLADPRPWVERVPRLAELKRRYTITMPATSIPEEERRALALYVLELGSTPEH